jgi:hypothetical protein
MSVACYSLALCVDCTDVYVLGCLSFYYVLCYFFFFFGLIVDVRRLETFFEYYVCR